MKPSRRKTRTSKPEAVSVADAEKQHGAYRKTILPNGLRVVSEEIPHVRSVSIGIWIDAGSRDEGEQTNGISHFIEHMVFKGTKKRNVKELAQSLESVGGYLNAFTGKEHTCFYARVLDEDTELAVDVLSDMVLNATFPEKELEKEKGVVIDELRQAEDDPDDIIHDYYEKAIFGKHPLGFPVIGTEQNLRSFTREGLLDYRHSKYFPSQMVVTAAGRIKHEDLLVLLDRYLKLPVPTSGQIERRLRPKAIEGGTFRHEKPIQQAHICLGTATYSIKSPHRYPLLVMNALLGDGMSSRLFQNIREKFGFAYTVYSFANLISDTGTFGVYVGTDKRHIDKSVELVWGELNKLKARPIPKAELNRTKAQLKGSMMLSLENIPNRMIRLGSSELYFGELSTLDSIIRKIDAVTQDEIQAIAQDLIQEAKFATVIFDPTNGTSSNPT